MTESAVPSATRFTSIKVVAICAATVTMCLLVLLHVRGVNGPWYWNWSWRSLSAAKVYPTLFLAAVPLIAAQYLYRRFPSHLALPLGLVTCSALALQLAAISVQPPGGLTRVSMIVAHPVVSSYYTSAKILYDQPNISVSEWLQIFPQIAPKLMMHARYKPPGLILFYYALMKAMGSGDSTALTGGFLIALAAAMAGPMTYLLIARFTKDKVAAFCGASFMALAPSLILFVPMFDQVYVSIAIGLLVLWREAIEAGGVRSLMWAVAFGALLALALFMSYIFLVLGLFLAVYTMLRIADAQGKIFGKAVILSLIDVATMAVLYGILWAATGFDPIATFDIASREQVIALIPLIRPFPQHVLFDVLDFAMGSGWIGFLLVTFYVARNGKRLLRVFHQSAEHRLIFLSLLQIAVTALAALLPGESARLWMLLLPLLMAPIGFELSRWPMAARVIVYGCLLILLAVICQNMTFLYLGPELDGPRS